LDTKESLKQYITEELLNNRVTITEEDNLLSDGMVDSLGMMRLVSFIEETFNVGIPPEDLLIENFRTVNTISDYLQRQIK
jgi:acyl carrier protein